MEPMKTITTLEPILKEHPFLKEFEPHHLQFIVGCASNVRFDAGQYLFHEGEEATHFYLIRRGKVALEIRPPNRPPINIQTIGEGEMLGWSWLRPPHRWHFDAHALDLTRAIAFDARCVRDKCDRDHDLGYKLAEQLADIQARRLEAMVLQLLDVYGDIKSIKGVESRGW